MKRILIYKLILLSCFVLSGCSFSVRYVVVNQSNSVLEIEYTVASKINFPEDNAMKPFKTTLSDWNAWFEKENTWQAVPQNEYEFDPQSRKCKIKLSPNEVLRISRQDDSILMTEKYENFYIENLRLKGENGEIAYEGKYFYKQFERKDEQNYFIAYR